MLRSTKGNKNEVNFLININTKGLIYTWNNIVALHSDSAVECNVEEAVHIVELLIIYLLIWSAARLLACIWKLQHRKTIISTICEHFYLEIALIFTIDIYLRCSAAALDFIKGLEE